MTLSEILNRIYPLPPSSIAKVEAIAEEIAVGKNVEFISANTVCRYIYFVGSGMVRAYCYAKGRDISFWIGSEGSVALSMQSYTDGRPGYECISTLEDSTLYRVASEALQELYVSDIHLANWGRKFAEKEILRAERCLIPQLFSTGRERYERLLTEEPELLQRIPLDKLAGYLGMTPVSLSRIRRELGKA